MTIPKSEGSVMENLVDMRDHLKATRAAMQAGIDPLRAATIRRDHAAPAADPKERRDLEEHLARDRAALARKLQEAELETTELRNDLSALDAIAAELSAAPDAEQRLLSDLRFRYHQTAGRISAIHAAAAPQCTEELPRSAGTIWRESVPIVAAILLAAGIIAGTLAFLLA